MLARSYRKIESVIGTVQRELWEVVHFDDVAEAERALTAFFADYNHRRAHLGIGSLVPADRFYGRWPEVIAEMDAISRRRQGALALQLDRRLFVEPPTAGERVLRGGLGDPGGGSRGDRVGGGQSDRPGGGQSDRRNWSNHARLGDQEAAKLIARGSRVAASVGARP